MQETCAPALPVRHGDLAEMSDHPNDKSLPRRALVVGGRGGIGRHIADRLSGSGYEVLIAGRSEADGALTFESMQRRLEGLP